MFYRVIAYMCELEMEEESDIKKKTQEYVQ